MKKILLFACIVIAATTSNAQRAHIYATANGNWDQPNTWNLHRVPSDNDSIVIPAGIKVTLSASKTLSNIFVDIVGILKIDEATTAGESNDLDIITAGVKTNMVIVRLFDGESRIEKGIDRDGGGRIRIKINNSGNFITKYSTETKLLTGTATAYNNLNTSFVKNPNGSLILVMMEFSISNSDKAVFLKWKAQQENNNDKYFVERSVDAHTWQKIAEIAAVPVSPTAQSYSFTDQQPVAGINYYRLRVVNKDGKYGLTPIKAVRIASNVKDVLLYPNPARTTASLYFNEKTTGSITVAIYNGNGHLIETKQSAIDSNILELNVSKLAPGNYLVHVQGTNSFKKTIRLFVIK